LLRIQDDFAYSVITLREAKNVKYGHFMQPGRSMQISVELVDQSETAEGKLAPSRVREKWKDGHGIGRLTLVATTCGTATPLGVLDEQIVHGLRGSYLVLRANDMSETCD